MWWSTLVVTHGSLGGDPRPADNKISLKSCRNFVKYFHFGNPINSQSFRMGLYGFLKLNPRRKWPRGHAQWPLWNQHPAVFVDAWWLREGIRWSWDLTAGAISLVCHWYVRTITSESQFWCDFSRVSTSQNLDQSVLAPVHRKNHGIATTSSAPAAAGCSHLCTRLRWNSWRADDAPEPHRQEGGELHPIGCHWTSGDFICHLALGPHVLEILGVSKCWDDNYSQRSTFARQINVRCFIIFRRFSRWTSGPHSSNRRKRVV